MKTPTNYGGFDLAAHLAGNNAFVMADLYTFVLAGGFTARHTSAEGGLTVGARTFDGNSIIITRGRTRTVIGVEVDTLDLNIVALPTHLLNGTPWLRALKAGALDGATVILERLFTPYFGSPQKGTYINFAGRVADMEVGRFSAKVRVNSDLEVLNVQMPRNLYQPGCLNTLYDGGCTLAKASYGVAGTVGSASATQITCSLGQAAGYFDLGTISFTSGANAGVSRSIKQYTPGSIALALPLLSVPVPGDSFTAYPGCDKTQATCAAKFANGANFRGYPFIPAPESVI